MCILHFCLCNTQSGTEPYSAAIQAMGGKKFRRSTHRKNEETNSRARSITPSPLRVVVVISLQFVTIPDIIISTPVASHTNSCIQSLQSLFESCVQPACASWSGEQSRISWAYYPKAVKTNEIVRSVIIMYNFPCNSKICTFLSRLSTKCFEHC